MIPSRLSGITYGPTPAGYGPALDLPPRLIVLHDTSNDASANAEAQYAHTRTDDHKTSAHFYVDSTEIIGSVPLDSQAWAAYNYANGHGWQIEMCGYNAGTAGAVPAATIDRAAQLVARLAALGGVPLVKLTPADVAAGKSGICGHYDITTGLHVGTHTDPGPSFDWAAFLALVDTATVPAEPGDLTTETMIMKWSTLAQGATGPRVRDLQALLNAHGAHLTVDGDFGPLTDAALRSFQVSHNVPHSVTSGRGDGQAGVYTLAALLDIQ